MIGAGGVPVGATAVIGNTTVTGGTANSFVTVFPAGGSVPNASNVNFAAGQTIPNLVAGQGGDRRAGGVQQRQRRCRRDLRRRWLLRPHVTSGRQTTVSVVDDDRHAERCGRRR